MSDTKIEPTSHTAPRLNGAKKRGDTIRIDGKWFEYLGSGRFTSAYRKIAMANNMRVRLYVYEYDPTKELLNTAWNRATVKERRHLPKVHFEAMKTLHLNEDGTFIYSTELYRTPRLTKPSYEMDSYVRGVKGTTMARDISVLTKAHKAAQLVHNYTLMSKQDCYDFNTTVIDQADKGRVTVELIDTLEVLKATAHEMSQRIIFDVFRPSNMGLKLTRYHQELIFRDPMFDYGRMAEITRERRTKNAKTLP